MRALRPGKKKTCPICKGEFTPERPMQKVCDPLCAFKYSVAQEERQRKKLQKAQEKEARAKLREAKERVRPRSKKLKAAQDAFNAFIRLRDRHEPCMCCGEWGDDQDWTPGGVWDAGHYLSVGARPDLRFNEDNCHKQLKRCNGGSGRFSKLNMTISQSYRVRLIEKIGVERVEALEGPYQPKRYTDEDLLNIAKLYRAKTRELKKKIAAEELAGLPITTNEENQHANASHSGSRMRVLQP